MTLSAQTTTILQLIGVDKVTSVRVGCSKIQNEGFLSGLLHFQVKDHKQVIEDLKTPTLPYIKPTR